MSLVSLVLTLAACHPPLDLNSAPGLRFESPSDASTLNEGQPVTIKVSVWDTDDLEVSVVLYSDDEPLGDTTITLGGEDEDALVVVTDALGGGDHTLRAVVSDYKTETTAQIIVHVNMAPTDPTVTLTPAAPRTDDALLAEIGRDSVDPDSPGVYLSAWWQQEGETEHFGCPTDGDPDSPILCPLGADKTARDDVWGLHTLVADADAGGQIIVGGAQREAVHRLTILNSPPSAPVVSIRPVAPSTMQDLVCHIDIPAQDPDPSDVLQDVFRWEVNGDPVLDQDTDTLSADLTHPDEVWTCTVVSKDDLEEGPSSSDSVTILAASVAVSGLAARIEGVSTNQMVGQSAVGMAMNSLDGEVDLVLGLPEVEGDLGRGQVALYHQSTLTGPILSSTTWAKVLGEAGHNLGYPLAVGGDVLGTGGTPDLLVVDDSATYVLDGESLSRTPPPPAPRTCRGW